MSLVSPFVSPALLPIASSGASSIALPGMLHKKRQEQAHRAALQEGLSSSLAWIEIWREPAIPRKTLALFVTPINTDRGKTTMTFGTPKPFSISRFN